MTVVTWCESARRGEGFLLFERYERAARGGREDLLRGRRGRRLYRVAGCSTRKAPRGVAGVYNVGGNEVDPQREAGGLLLIRTSKRVVPGGVRRAEPMSWIG